MPEIPSQAPRVCYTRDTFRISVTVVKIWAFIPAGGVGQRMGEGIPKQYLSINGKPMLQHSVERLAAHERVAGVVVGVAAHDEWFGMLEGCPVHGVTLAGEQRADTVLNGLAAMLEFTDPQDWVLVHDAARPLVRREDVDGLIRAALPRPDGALLAIPVADTLKRVDDSGHVHETLDRAQVWRAATPQMFPLRILENALASALSAGSMVTDESAAMELAGYRPAIVPCALDNIKVTIPSDLALAEWLMKQQ
jgi:2-C-methyl-D-erythritol 4-phosphate cytidylyltransferase